jgi:hypothetical protein
LPRFFDSTVPVFLSAWRSNIVVVSNKGIAKTPSVRAFFLQRKSQLFVHLLGTRTLLRMNIGYFRKPYTGFGVARVTGLNRSTILRSIGLVPNAHDPCFYTGLVWNPLDPSASQSSVPLSLGLYIDDFVYFSEDQKKKKTFWIEPSSAQAQQSP